MGSSVCFAIMTVCLVTEYGFAHGFSKEQLPSIATQYHLRENEGVEPESGIEDDELTYNKRLHEILALAYGALKSEKQALGDIASSVSTQSVSEMRRLTSLANLFQEYSTPNGQRNTGNEYYGAGKHRATNARDVVQTSALPVRRITKRRHRKRSTFDSISHNGSLGGLGQAESERRRGKLAFTFQNLLPFLLNEQRRNNRAAVRRRVL